MLPMDGFVVRCVFGREGCELAPLLTSPAGGGGTAPSPRAGRAGADKGTSLEFTVCEARTLFRPHPQPLSHCVGEGCRGARRCALQRVPPLPQAGELIRVHRLSSLCARRARFFALTPSPSPTAWERGVGAHGGAPCSAFPLSRRRERGTKGVRAIQRTCRFTLALGKIAPASKTSCRTVVPLPEAGEGDKGGEGNTAHLPVHACAGKNSPCFKDFVPNRCTLTRRAGVGANGC
jgi:hypothetical protein